MVASHTAHFQMAKITKKTHARNYYDAPARHNMLSDSDASPQGDWPAIDQKSWLAKTPGVILTRKEDTCLFETSYETL